MTDFPISDEAVEAVGDAIKNQWISEGPHWLPKDCAHAAIQAFLEAEGFEVERTAEWRKGDLTVPFHNDRGAFDSPRGGIGEGWEKVKVIYRLISKWRPDEAT